MSNLKKFIGIWYDLTIERKREEIMAVDEDDARDKLHIKYNSIGEKEPAELLNVIECKNL